MSTKVSDELAIQLMEVALSRAEREGVATENRAAYAMGYITAVVGTMAKRSPDAMLALKQAISDGIGGLKGRG